MANTTKFVTKNGLQTQNVLYLSEDGTSNISLNMYANGSLSWSGSAGQLFSVVDDLSNTIFSVNDISGLPVIEVFANGEILMNEFAGNLTLGGNLLAVDAAGPGFLNEAATLTNPTLVPNKADDDTGLAGNGANELSLVVAGVNTLNSTSTFLTFNVNAEALNAAGPGFLNEAATSTNPTLVPNKADDDTGIAWHASNELSLVAGGAQMALFNSVQTTINSASLRMNTSDGPAMLNETASVTNPTLVPNRADDDTGIGWTSADNLSIIAGGVNTISSTATLATLNIATTFSDHIRSATGAGPRLMNEAATGTNPTLIPNQADTDTGIGWQAANNVSIVAGGVESARFDTVGQIEHLDTALTATGSVQSDALHLAAQVNDVTTVAAGTGVELPTTPTTGSLRITVMNHGANDLNVYPPPGAKINALATNAAIALSANAVVDFISSGSVQWYTRNATYA